MNLDRTFCVSPCGNAAKCDRVYSRSIWMAAEKIGKQLSIAELHPNCDEYRLLIPSQTIITKSGD